ncbi:hypothetical protein ACQP1P_37330 [Dactylosporangium sp. CA-052675]|uniref:hypothetical protein n=1 Tax=Dactylosporangium sp. CA-052675 TaxID=3239927 RepID=UPI003D8E9C09
MQPEGDELAPQPDEDAPPAPESVSAAPTDGSAPVSGAAPVSGPASVSGAAPVSGPAPAHGSAAVNGSPYRPVGGSAGTLAALWNDGDRQRIKAKWQELQLRFIDDPHLVAGEAERLVQEAVASLSASLDARRGQLHQQRAARGLDTENLRASLRDYREFLDRILGL